MAITTTVIDDNDEFIGYQDWDDETKTASYRREFKAGSKEANRAALEAKLRAQRDAFAANFANWSSLSPTNQQLANKQLHKAMANLIDFVLKNSETTGV